MVMRASMEKELRLMKTRNISRKNWQVMVQVSIVVDKEKCESGKEENISSQGTDLLMAVRKRSLEEGQKALKLGVLRGYGEARQKGEGHCFSEYSLFNRSLTALDIIDYV
ncbi:unnamed protein product [Prunus armeniaca]